MERQSISQSQQQVSVGSPLSRGGILQRKCDCGQQVIGGGECGHCRKQNSSIQHRTVNSIPLQRRAIDHSEISKIPPIVYEVLSSPGQPLDPETRDFMESRFKSDFGHIRIHTDAKAAKSAEAVNALAFTVGQGIVFGAGQYNPKNQPGKQLLGHELAHTLQQRNAIVIGSEINLDKPSSPHEKRADEAGKSALQEGSISRIENTIRNVLLQRQVRDENTERVGRSTDPHWFIEADPPSSIIRSRDTVVFKLRHYGIPFAGGPDLNPEISVTEWQDHPTFEVHSADGISFPTLISEMNYPLEFSYRFEAMGKNTVYFTGTPLTYSGDVSPITVTYELFVINHQSQPDRTALTHSSSFASSDSQAIQDSSISTGELLEVFQRLTLRRALETLSRNMQEANDLERIYAADTHEENPRINAARDIFELYSQLLDRRNVLSRRQHANPRAVALRGTLALEEAELASRELQERIQPAIDRIEGMFPELSALARNESASDIFLPSFRAQVRRSLDIVQGDISSTRLKLITGDLEILNIRNLVNDELRNWESNSRLRLAVEAVLSERTQADFLAQIAPSGISLALLFIPAIGPALSAVAGIGFDIYQVATSWNRVEDLTAAANAGVRGGILVQEEADEARRGAIWDTFLAGLGIVLDIDDITDPISSAFGRLVRRGSRDAAQHTSRAVGEAASEGSARRTDIFDEPDPSRPPTEGSLRTETEPQGGDQRTDTFEDSAEGEHRLRYELPSTHELPSAFASCSIGSLICPAGIPVLVRRRVGPYPYRGRVPYPSGGFLLRGTTDTTYQALRRVTGRQLRRIYLNNPQVWSRAFREEYEARRLRFPNRDRDFWWPREGGHKWQVHHRKPLDFGGDNNPANLVALEPSIHQEFTSWWNSLKRAVSQYFTTEQWEQIIGGEKNRIFQPIDFED